MNQLTMPFFECLHALQTCALASTPLCPSIFPITSAYSNLNYLFWRNNDIEDLELDREIYPWIIWLLWKAWCSQILPLKSTASAHQCAVVYRDKIPQRPSYTLNLWEKNQGRKKRICFYCFNCDKCKWQNVMKLNLWIKTLAMETLIKARSWNEQ